MSRPLRASVEGKHARCDARLRRAKELEEQHDDAGAETLLLKNVNEYAFLLQHTVKPAADVATSSASEGDDVAMLRYHCAVALEHLARFYWSRKRHEKAGASGVCCCFIAASYTWLSVA